MRTVLIGADVPAIIDEDGSGIGFSFVSVSLQSKAIPRASQIFMNSNLPIQESIYKQLIVDKISLNLGMIFENVIAQILRSRGYDLYFHNFDHHEIDFMLSKGKKIIPLEVKSSAYKNHKSLDLFCQKYSKQISERYVIYAKDLRTDGNTVFIPFYMAMFL